MKQVMRFCAVAVGIAGAAWAQGLVITEIMYYPPDSGPDCQYVEVYNETRGPIDVSGYRFTEGFAFVFPDGTWIEPYAYIVVARDPAAFESVYGFQPFGPFLEGTLDHAGERITLSNDSGKYATDGTEIAHAGIVSTVAYNNRGEWPAECAGTGHSISLRRVESDPDAAASWAPSPVRGGTPGRPNGFELSFVDTVLVAQGAVWKYTRGTAEASAPIEAWRELAFDDQAWTDGTASFGYGSSVGATTVFADMRQTAENPTGYTTLYVRKKFTVADKDGIDRLQLKLYYDDGFVAYLNGREIARDRVTAEPPAFNSIAGSVHSPTLLETIDVSRALEYLLPGDNVLCVQGVNRSLTDTDFLLHPSLVMGKSIKPFDDAATVVINECYYHGAGTLWAELYNTGAVPVAIGGYHLSRNAADLGAFESPAGTSLPAGGFIAFDAEQLGFELRMDVGESGALLPMTLYFSNPALDRVVSARTFEEDVPFGRSQARMPDGRGAWVNSDQPTRAGANKATVERAVVINEIMYRPLHSPNPHDAAPTEEPQAREYIELYNNSDRMIDLSGWRFTKGITYVFEEGAVIGPREYLVVARDPALIARIYGNESRVVGPYQGQLADGGELVRLKDQYSNTADEVAYVDGGEWPRWADGGGSSMELVDPNQDNSLPSAWAGSDDRAKAQWTKVEFSGRHASAGESEITFLLTNDGEMLLDEVSVSQTPGGANMMQNAGFENGLTGNWRVWAGTLEETRVVEGDAHEGTKSLLVVATGHGDNCTNNFEYNLTNPALRAGTTYYVSYWAKWQRGTNRFLARGHRAANVATDNLAFTANIPVPEKLGTPGARNSTAVDNQGPVFGRLAQNPAMPVVGAGVQVACAVSDSDGVQSVALSYRLDETAAVTLTEPMLDDGAHGDGAAGDGVYGGWIPAFASSKIVIFWITATDAKGAASTYPAAGENAPFAYQVIGTTTPSELPRYRYMLRAKDRTRLTTRIAMSNSLVPMTFVYNASTIYYHCGMRFRGSPWIRPGSPGTGYRFRFNEDQKLHGRLRTVNLDFQPGEDSGDMRDPTAFYLMRWLSRAIPGSTLPYSWTVFIRLYDGNSDKGFCQHVQRLDKQYLEFWFGEDDSGTLYKTDDWFESGGDGNPSALDDADLSFRTDYREAYRWFYKIRTNEPWDSYEPIMAFTKFISQTSSANMLVEAPKRVDVEEWTGILSVRLYIADWDTIGIDRGKNAYIYYPSVDARWRLLPWDSDLAFQSNNTGKSILVGGSFPQISKLLSTPSGLRRFYQNYLDLIAGPANAVTVKAFHTRMAQTFSGEIAKPPAPTGEQSFMAARNSNILNNQIPKATFRVRTPASPYVTDKENLNIVLDAPAAVRRILLDGEPIDAAVTWTNASQCRYPATLPVGQKTWVFTALDATAKEIGRAELVTTFSTNPAPTVASISPGEGADEGGTAVTVSGANFLAGAKVFLGGVECAQTVVVDAATLTAVTPAAAPRGTRAVEVKVVNSDTRAGVLTGGFTYLALWPNILGVAPNRGPIEGGQNVEITGERFAEGIAVLFGEAQSTSVVLGSATQLTVRVPAATAGGTVDVRVRNADGRSSTLSAGYSYELPLPEVTEVVPNHGDVAGGEIVTLNGANFQVQGDPIVVTFGFDLAEVREASQTRIVVVSPPAMSAGTVLLTVTDGGGRLATPPGGFTYTETPQPVFLRGDATGDGALNVSDATRVLKYLFGTGAVACMDAADVNDDGKIGLDDAVRLFAYMYAGGVAPAMPFPSPGVDATKDSLGCGA